MGKSKFNPIFEFDYQVNGQDRLVRVTSVLGHIMNLRYPDSCKSWHNAPMESLYDVGVIQEPVETSKMVVKNFSWWISFSGVWWNWFSGDKTGGGVECDTRWWWRSPRGWNLRPPPATRPSPPVIKPGRWKITLPYLIWFVLVCCQVQKFVFLGNQQ